MARIEFARDFPVTVDLHELQDLPIPSARRGVLGDEVERNLSERTVLKNEDIVERLLEPPRYLLHHRERLDDAGIRVEIRSWYECNRFVVIVKCEDFAASTCDGLT